MLDDTVGSAARRDAGVRTLALVDQLAHGGAHERTGRDSLPADQRRELAEEWDHLTRAGGRLKSYQLLGTTRTAGDSTDVSIVRLKFQRDSLLLAVGWKNGALAYTSPGTQNLVAASVFAPGAADEWLSVDWLTGDVHRLTINRSVPDGAPVLTLQTRRGPVIYTRR